MFKSRRSVYDETRNTNCTEMDNNQRTTNDHSKAWTVITQLHLTWHEWSRWTTTRPNLGRQYGTLIYRDTLEHQTTLEWIRYCKYVIFLFNKTHYFSNPTQKGSVYKLVSSCVGTTITCIMISWSANLYNTNFKHIASKSIQYQTNWHMTRSSQSHGLQEQVSDKRRIQHQLVPNCSTECSNRNAPNSTRMTRWNVQRNTDCKYGHTNQMNVHTKSWKLSIIRILEVHIIKSSCVSVITLNETRTK